MTDSRLAGLNVDVATSPTPDSRLAGLNVDVAVVGSPKGQLAGLEIDVAVAIPTSASTAYGTVVLSDSPEGYWPLNESTPDFVIDASGHGHHGLLTGGTLGVAAAGTTMGTAYSFTTSSTDGIDCGHSAVIGTGLTAMTVEAWSKTTASQTFGMLAVARDFGGPSGSNNYQLYWTSGKPAIGFYCASGYREDTRPNYQE